MKEPPRGPLERATAVAEGFAAAVRRRQRDREPRVLLYRRPGDPRILAPGAKGHDAILQLAEAMVAIADEAEGRDAPPRRGRARRDERQLGRHRRREDERAGGERS